MCAQIFNSLFFSFVSPTKNLGFWGFLALLPKSILATKYQSILLSQAQKTNLLWDKYLPTPLTHPQFTSFPTSQSTNYPCYLTNF